MTIQVVNTMTCNVQPFVQRILEKWDKFWRFITQVEYNLSCHVKSLPRFSLVVMN